MIDYEIDQIVDCLYKILVIKERVYERFGKKMFDEEIVEMVIVYQLVLKQENFLLNMVSFVFYF